MYLYLLFFQHVFEGQPGGFIGLNTVVGKRRKWRLHLSLCPFPVCVENNQPDPKLFPFNCIPSFGDFRYLSNFAGMCVSFHAASTEYLNWPRPPPMHFCMHAARWNILYLRCPETLVFVNTQAIYTWVCAYFLQRGEHAWFQGGAMTLKSRPLFL